MSEEKNAAEPRMMTQEEEDGASGPAVLCNRTFISVGPYGVRLAFAEFFTDTTGPIFRTAVVMPHQDAVNLMRTLRVALEPIEKALAEAEAAAKAASNG